MHLHNGREVWNLMSGRFFTKWVVHDPDISYRFQKMCIKQIFKVLKLPILSIFCRIWLSVMKDFYSKGLIDLIYFTKMITNLQHTAISWNLRFSVIFKSEKHKISTFFVEVVLCKDPSVFFFVFDRKKRHKALISSEM